MEKWIKFVPPNKLNKAPRGQIWSHVLDEGIEQNYIQTGEDLEEPEWEKFSVFLENIFMRYIDIPTFIQLLLINYDQLKDINSTQLQRNDILKALEKSQADY